MRDHADESANGINEDVEWDEDPKSSPNFHEDELRGPHQESGNDYHRDSLLNIEDQVETSKLVLQLVTDSRFNMTQINGQRKLGGPPPGWKGPAPGPGCEVFVGKIPRTLYEHEIYPIFSRMGEVYEIRLMMDFSGTNRGYCFVMFGKPEFAQRAIKELDNFEIRPGRKIGVVASINNCRLYVGQLPLDIKSESVIRKIYDITDDVGQVAVYRNANGQAKYSLISYKTHRGAAMARRRLVPERASLFAGSEVSVDWAHPSMFPSNMVEDTGICDGYGNVEISRSVIGNENKRQNRRRVKDTCLDQNIRSYLQSDRAMDLRHSSRNQKNTLQNQSFNPFYIYEQNSNSRSQNHFQQYNSKHERIRDKMEMGKISRESDSSFDLHVCSGSSESSGCSSQSSASERHHNLSKEFSDVVLGNFYPYQNFHSVDNDKEFFSEQAKIGGKILESSSNELGDKKIGNNDEESLNLFDNYTFLVNSRETGDREDFNEVENYGNDFSPDILENNSVNNEPRKIHNEETNYADFFMERGEKLLPKINKDSGTIMGTKTMIENDRKSREQMCKNFLNHENNNFLDHPSAICGLTSQNFGNSMTFQKAIGFPIKNEIFKASGAQSFSNFSRPENRNGMSSLMWNKNSKNSATARLVAENYLMQQQLCENGTYRSAAAHTFPKIPNSFNPHYFSQSLNFDAKKAWLSAQLRLNACNYSSNNLANVSFNHPRIYSDAQFLREQHAALRTSASGFLPQSNSPVMNFYPAQNFPHLMHNGYSQITKIPNRTNPPKCGRPILSRSYANICNEN